jgi:hypothetical protein
MNYRGSSAAPLCRLDGRTVLSRVGLTRRRRMNTTLASEVLIQKASPESTSV